MENNDIINSTPTSIPEQKVVIIYKPPEYTKRAQRAHYNRNKDNEDFMKKKMEQTNKWREENRNEYNEKQKLLMRERRAKAKKEKDENDKNTIANIIENT
jgi:hypothetical protein